MRKLTIAMSSALIAALSLPALADLTLSGSARYRLGSTESDAGAEATNDVYRNGQLLLSIKAGNDDAGFQTNITNSFDGSENGGTGVSVDSSDAYGWLNLGDAKLMVGNFGASAGMGVYGVGRDDDAQSLQIEGGNDQFTVFVRNNRGHSIDNDGNDEADNGCDEVNSDAVINRGFTLDGDNLQYICEKKDYTTYGVTAELGAISFEYQHGNESVKGIDDLAVTEITTARNGAFAYTSFDSIYASTNFGSAKVEAQLVNTGITESDARALRVSMPLEGYDLSLAYATFDPYYADSWAPFGSGILDGAYDVGNLTGNSATGDAETNPNAEDTRFIGVKVAGAVGDTGLNFAAVMGSYDDQVATTGNSVYDINLSYAVAKGATIKVGMGEANDISGLGARVDYSF